MGWRFRQSQNLGPVRTTITKRGVGWGLNLGICRVGISPQGKKYVSFGLPGTGLYYIRYLSDSTKYEQAQSQSDIKTPSSTASLDQKHTPNQETLMKMKKLKNYSS